MILNIDKERGLPAGFNRQLQDFLKLNSASALFCQQNRGKIVIASPHHAPQGYSRMLCERNADENAGYLAACLSEILDCSLVIANRYFCDPNKSKNTDYFQFIEKLKPELVIEIHGHGKSKAEFDIEISSGHHEPLFAEEFAIKLKEKMKAYSELQKYSISGDYGKIYYTAQYSLTVTDNRWHTLHIELPPELRKVKGSVYPPADGFYLMGLIADLCMI